MHNLKTRMRKLCVALITVINFSRFRSIYLKKKLWAKKHVLNKEMWVSFSSTLPFETFFFLNPINI